MLLSAGWRIHSPLHTCAGELLDAGPVPWASNSMSSICRSHGWLNQQSIVLQFNTR